MTTETFNGNEIAYILTEAQGINEYNSVRYFANGQEILSSELSMVIYNDDQEDVAEVGICIQCDEEYILLEGGICAHCDSLNRKWDIENNVDDAQKEQLGKELNSCATKYNIPLADLLAREIMHTDLDTEQMAIKINDDVYIYSENRDGEYVTCTMDLSDYDLEAINSMISSYYSSVDEVKKIYKEEWKQIVLECIFEEESL